MIMPLICALELISNFGYVEPILYKLTTCGAAMDVPVIEVVVSEKKWRPND